MRRLARWSVFVGVACMAFGTGSQQAFAYQDDVLEEPIVTGRIIENVVAPDDPSQSLSLYLPTAYTADQQWPIVFLMDPRGNSLVPLRMLVPVAERLGYILASSNNTASDVNWDPNTPAVNAMISTLQPRLSLDLRRFYLLGMSGTARVAWALGYAAIPHIAGVIGFAAGLPPEMDLEAAQGQYGAPFVYYGGVGDRDFNHSELVLMESRLRGLGIKYSMSYYAGRHGWPQEDSEYVAALSWMHLMAMQRGLMEVDSTWVSAEYAIRLEAAKTLEQAGNPHQAWRSYAAIAVDFRGLTPTETASERATVLAADEGLPVWRARRIGLARAHGAYKAVAVSWLEEAMNSHPTIESALEDLALDSLKAVASDSTDVDGAAAAQRVLADLYSMTSFYHTRFHIDRKDWRRARLTLEIADSVFPGTRRVCTQLVQVLAELGADPVAGLTSGCAATAGQ